MMSVRPINFPEMSTNEVPQWLSGQADASVQTAFQSPETSEQRQEAAVAQLQQQVAETLAQAEAEGLKRGEETAKIALEKSLARMDLIFDELVDIRTRVLNSLHEQIIDIALCCARTILDHEVATMPDYLPQLVSDAVRLIADGDSVEISVAPADLEPLQERLSTIIKNNPRAGTLALKPDDSLDSGCVVETRLARVDATFAARLKNIGESLHGSEEL